MILRTTSNIVKALSRRRSVPTSSAVAAARPTTPSAAAAFSTLITTSSSGSQTNIINNKDRSFLPHKLQIRSLFIQTDETPNPESLKFVPGRDVLGENPDETTNGFYATRSDKEEIARSPLTKRLFAIDGVKAVYLGTDYVTVTKFATSHWAHVRTQVFSALMDHYDSKELALTDQPEITDTTILDDDDEVVAMIKELLESRIRPAVQEDGGDIRYVGFDDGTGIVTVQLAGSCVGCPSSSVTLKNGVENMLMHYIPEVTAVEALEEEDEEGQAPKEEEPKQNKSYEERLAAAGIPFSD
mmetsp:Transcript_26663/g.37577  ORF Transcript_26663/g.37577 Transcript_26663/m.37577 type:complete len:299 (-) Transcript_26663:52-948(-)